jgi:oligosaccharyltransferase complex subunit alpha (ribophorin I)
VRTIDLGGSLVHVTTTYAAKALNPDTKGYIIALSPDEDKKTSFMEVKEKGSKDALDIEFMGVDDNRFVLPCSDIFEYQRNLW